MKRGRKIMYWVTGITAFVILGIVVWFAIPYSPMKAEFLQFKSNQSSDQQPSGQVFTMEDFLRTSCSVTKIF